jgi:TatD DNase family protein
MFFDTHLHLADSQFEADRDAVMGRARDAGVTTLVEIAECPESWDAAIRFAEQYPPLYASLGIHPHDAHRFGLKEWPGVESRLRELLKHPKVVGIGEFGLDYYRMRNTREQQDYLFRRQLELAKELDKPIILHCREDETSPPPSSSSAGGEENRRSGAHADLQKGIVEFFPNTSLSRTCLKPIGVMHCFSGTWEDAQTYLMHGFMVGIDAPVTYPKNERLRTNVRRLPLERIVLETDAPYLPPQTHRGQRNEPAYIPAIAAEIGALKRKTPEDVGRQTSLNAKALFRL